MKWMEEYVLGKLFDKKHKVGVKSPLVTVIIVIGVWINWFKGRKIRSLINDTY